MVGPKSRFRLPGCALTLALAGVLLAVFFLFQPARAPKPATGAGASAMQLASPAKAATAGPQFPQLTGRVVDAANVIPDDIETRIDQKLAALETNSHRQLVVTTLPSLQGYEISDYGYQLGRAWGIGSKDKNDGALLIVAPNERKLRVEVGYGLEGILTDGLSSVIINDQIVPKFKAGDLPGGIEAGTDALIAQLSLPEDQARALAAQAKPAAAPESGISIGTIIWLAFIFFFFILPIIRSMRGGRRYGSGIGPVVVWGGSGSGSGGSSWGGGGGFSGGGGSFGGGGSSGSW